MNHLQNFKKLDIKTRKMISSNLAGNFKSAFKGKGLEFEEFKEYEEGEDSKYIDWLVSARENRLLSKRYSQDKSIKVFFVLDIGSNMDFGIGKKKKDTLIEAFLLLALSSIENGDSVGALLFNESSNKFFGHKKGKAHIFEIYKNIVDDTVIAKNEAIQKEGNNIVNELLLKNSQGQNSEKGQNSNPISLSHILTFLCNIKLKNNLVFILTDNMDFKDDKNLKVLSLKNDIVFVNIFDDFENTLNGDLENSGVLGFLGDKKEAIYIDNLDKEKLKEYKELRLNKILNLKKYLQSFGISYLKIDNLSNIYKDFFIHFNRN